MKCGVHLYKTFFSDKLLLKLFARHVIGKLSKYNIIRGLSETISEETASHLPRNTPDK